MYFKDKKHSPSAFVGRKAHYSPTLQRMRLVLDFYTLFNLVFQEIFVTLLPGIQMTMNMTTYALNNLWNYLQGLSLSQSDREWLADKLIMPDKVQEDTAKDDSLTEFLKMEGTWSDDAEGEEYYQMMKHRNDGRPLNREISFDD